MEPDKWGLTVFQDDQVVLLSNRVDFLPPFQAECGTGGVLAATAGLDKCTCEGERGRKLLRDGVEDMGELSLLLGVPGRKDSLEFLRNETTIIDLDGGPSDALGGNSVGQGREGEFVSEERVSSVAKEPETLGDTITVPESERDQVIPRRMEDINQPCQGLERGRDSGTGTVGESGSEGESIGRFPVGNRLGGTRAVSPFENGVGGFNGGNFEEDLPDWVKTNVRIA